MKFQLTNNLSSFIFEEKYWSHNLNVYDKIIDTKYLSPSLEIEKFESFYGLDFISDTSIFEREFITIIIKDNEKQRYTKLSNYSNTSTEIRLSSKSRIRKISRIIEEGEKISIETKNIFYIFLNYLHYRRDIGIERNYRKQLNNNQINNEYLYSKENVNDREERIKLGQLSLNLYKLKKIKILSSIFQSTNEYSFELKQLKDSDLLDLSQNDKIINVNFPINLYKNISNNLSLYPLSSSPTSTSKYTTNLCNLTVNIFPSIYDAYINPSTNVKFFQFTDYELSLPSAFLNEINSDKLIFLDSYFILRNFYESSYIDCNKYLFLLFFQFFRFEYSFLFKDLYKEFFLILIHNNSNDLIQKLIFSIFNNSNPFFYFFNKLSTFQDDFIKFYILFLHYVLHFPSTSLNAKDELYIAQLLTNFLLCNDDIKYSLNFFNHFRENIEHKFYYSSRVNLIKLLRVYINSKNPLHVLIDSIKYISTTKFSLIINFFSYYIPDELFFNFLLLLPVSQICKYIQFDSSHSTINYDVDCINSFQIKLRNKIYQITIQGNTCYHFLFHHINMINNDFFFQFYTRLNPIHFNKMNNENENCWILLFKSLNNINKDKLKYFVNLEEFNYVLNEIHCWTIFFNNCRFYKQEILKLLLPFCIEVYKLHQDNLLPIINKNIQFYPFNLKKLLNNVIF